MKKFAIIGAAGYIAPKHVQAIYNIGGKVVATYDLSDSVGYLDKYDFEIMHFTKSNTFFEFIRKKKVDFVSICSPNYIHAEHTITALTYGFDVICEKPAFINDYDLKQIQSALSIYKKNIYPILQLRYHSEFVTLKSKISKDHKYDVTVTYVTPRGKWYKNSWKDDPEKSGGLLMNIGVHLIDLLIHLFGPVTSFNMIRFTKNYIKGTLCFENANANIMLSIDTKRMPEGRDTPLRKFFVGAHEIDLGKNTELLHSVNYSNIVSDTGLTFDSAVPAITLINSIRKKYE